MKIADNKITRLFAMVIAAIAIAASAPEAAAQITSPYSRYGYGLLSDYASSAQRQMGGIGYAMRSGRQINAMNPASYAACDSMTFIFDMGFDVSHYNRTDADGSKDSDWGGSLQYITIQVPITKWIGMSAGLVPYSRVGYAFGSDINNGTATHQGTGGLNDIYLGIGLEPLKGFSVGANVGYLFGNIVNDVYASQTGGSAAIFEQKMEVKDYSLQFGAQYALPLNRADRIVVGLTYSPKKTFLGKTYITKYLQSSSGSASSAEVIDPGEVSLRGNFEQAESWGAGVAFDRGDRLHIEADFTYQPWSKAKYTQLENFTATRLADRWKVAVGGSIIPALRGSYLKRVSYRLGGFYHRDYMMVGDNHVREWGASCGFGLPVQQAKTVINIGFEYHNRQATPVALLKEDYFQLNIGVNFNAMWFFQNKLR